MRERRRPDPSGDPAQAAYLSGLRLLAGRELSAFQIRQRLRQRGFSPADTDAALDKLRAGRALDDRRAALAAARTERNVKRHGPERALRQLLALGIDRHVARDAVAETFGEGDEQRLAEAALARRIGRSGQHADDPAGRRRLRAWLMRQGFSGDTSARALRARGVRSEPDDGDERPDEAGADRSRRRSGATRGKPVE